MSVGALLIIIKLLSLSLSFIGNLQSVFRLQKRSARIILDADKRANSDEPFTRLDWLPLHLEVKVNICVQVHKRINVRSPGYNYE